MVPLDTLLPGRSRGRLSVGKTLGVSSLLLTTTGACTDQPCPTPLFYVVHDGGYAVGVELRPHTSPRLDGQSPQDPDRHSAGHRAEGPSHRTPSQWPRTCR
ncbi:nitroreductase/quinone reductase family protein [Streptomyces sp. NPDC054887]